MGLTKEYFLQLQAAAYGEPGSHERDYPSAGQMAQRAKIRADSEGYEFDGDDDAPDLERVAEILWKRGLAAPPIVFRRLLHDCKTSAIMREKSTVQLADYLENSGNTRRLAA